MIALIASLLGLGGAAGSAAHSSANGPSGCSLCCGRSAVAQGLPPKRLSATKEAAMSLLRGYTFGNAGNVLMSRSSPTTQEQRSTSITARDPIGSQSRREEA
jgi:hypothetical protein